jgi:glycosyltransferase 2 family protein
VKRAINLGLSLLVTGVSFWWTFKDTKWDPLWASLKSANYVMLFPYLGILTLIHICRTIRWGNLLAGLEKIPFKKLNEAAAIGFMMLIILPFRLGEFARPFLIAQRSNIRRSAAMTTVVFERLVDGISIAILLRVFLFFIPADTDPIRRIHVGANIMFAVFGGGLAFLLFAAWQHDRAVRFVRAIAGVVSPKLADKVANVVDGFVGATKQLPDKWNLASFFVLTAIYWALNAFGMGLLARAFDCSGDPTGQCVPMTLDTFQSFVVLAVLIGGLMIPAAPGSAGTFQASIKLGLSVFLTDAAVNSSGVAYANVLWVVQIGQQILFGFILMLLSHQSFSDVAGKLGEEQPAPNAPAA